MAEWKIKGIYKADADKVYNEISALSEVTPEKVLEKAKNKRSELHRCFCWDDSEAAHRYRLQQARGIIQMLVVTPRAEEEQPTRIFQISSEKNVYQENTFFIQNQDEYQILLKRALAELDAFKRRYATLSELENVMRAINEL